MPQQADHLYEFGPFRLDVAERLLRRQGQVVPLTAKVFDLLVVLVENRGRLVEKDYLLKTIWPDSFVEEANLSVNVSALRKALGELPNNPQYVETVPKRGYRFVAPVKEAADGASSSGVEERTKSAPEPAPTEAPRPRRGWLLGVAAALLVLCGAGAYLVLQNVHKADGLLVTDIRSIAVLPFLPLAGDESQNYLGLGMADALITRLSNIRRVTVRATSAVLKYSSSKDLLAAGRELGVDALVEGRIQRQDRNIRVTVQLLRVRDGAPLWAQTFDDSFTNIFQVQDSISEKIAGAISLKLSEPERQSLTKRHTENTEAYQLYLQGLYFASKRTQQGTATAIQYYQQAAAKDPEYALPYAGMASCYITQAGVGLGEELREKARMAAMKASNLDPGLAEAHVALGQVLMRGDWDWAGAGRAFDRAITIDGNLAPAHWAKSTLLTAQGRHEEAIREMEMACSLDPASPAMRSDLGWTLYCARRYDEAIQYSRKAVEMDPWSFTAHRELAKEYLVKSMYAEAIGECRKTLDLVGGRRSRELADLGYAYAVSGNQAEAQAILAELKQGSRNEAPPYYALAVLQASLGEKDAAFESLENACRQRLSRPIWMKVDPVLDPLRRDSRFRDLLRRNRLASE